MQEYRAIASTVTDVHYTRIDRNLVRTICCRRLVYVVSVSAEDHGEERQKRKKKHSEGVECAE